MVVVVKKKGESTDRLFKRFTKAFRDENITFDVNKKKYFKTKKEIKKDKQKDKAKRRSFARKYSKRAEKHD